MPVYGRLVEFAKIASASRNGAEMVLSVLNAVRGRHLRYRGTVTFVGVTQVDNVDERNDLVQRELDELGPHRTTVRLDLERGIAVLDVHETDMHDVYPVLHRIECQEVKVKMRSAVLRTLANALY